MTILSYRNNYISYRDARGVRGHAPRNFFKMIDAIGASLIFQNKKNRLLGQNIWGGGDKIHMLSPRLARAPLEIW